MTILGGPCAEYQLIGLHLWEINSQSVMNMKKIILLLVASALLVAGPLSAKDIRVVEISTGSGVGSDNYDSSLQTILKTLAGVSKIVSDVANLVLTVTYDADQIGVDDIVNHINKAEPRFEAKQKSEPKTKKWVKAEKKLEKEKEEAYERDRQRGQQSDDKGGKPADEKSDKGSADQGGGQSGSGQQQPGSGQQQSGGSQQGSGQGGGQQGGGQQGGGQDGRK